MDAVDKPHGERLMPPITPQIEAVEQIARGAWAELERLAGEELHRIFEERSHMDPYVMTREEREAFDSLSETARLIMGLPSLHPMQGHEYAQMIHALQRAVLSRPQHRALIDSGESSNSAPLEP